MQKTIEIIVSPTGELKIDCLGFKGPDCEQATKFLEEALGMTAETVKKPEFNQRTTRTTQQKLGR
jgi:hypothetical protein